MFWKTMAPKSFLEFWRKYSWWIPFLVKPHHVTLQYYWKGNALFFFLRIYRKFPEKLFFREQLCLLNYSMKYFVL